MVLTEKTQVLIVGAGPAGLVLGNLLRAADIACVIVERQSRAHVEQRGRAGFLAPASVRVLEENGLAKGLLAAGQRHDTCAFRGEHGQFELHYGERGQREALTVYPQQLLVADLIAEFLDRGGDIRFGTVVTGMHDLDGGAPSVDCLGPDGEAYRLCGEYAAGCDGQRGVSVRQLPAGAAQRFRRYHGVTWLAVLAQAPPSMEAVTYAVHDRGFAGHMARSTTVTRYYLQVPRGEDPEDWSDARIWDELGTRMRTGEYGALREGPVLERGTVDLGSAVSVPMQYGRLFLAGDAAGLISPSAAKGANLAIVTARTLAAALTDALTADDQRGLVGYSDACLPRMWHAQEFSHWMINLLHGPAGDDEDAVFLRLLQRARLMSLRDLRSHQDYFAENYVGV
ncbi:4-hydroxybenzoate 3-monooxygenase [Streptomyces sp. 8L]|uniref:4-hydroxybenzoate 3-monooxygenase n=1 Tax=Streptomyces sp. 8L TaxID=2877242 RepID=UPI001CD2CE63|nr:4-hydroxybenzoate 3-monooxygenase [Streptomyces sp. 8L]MCA1219831.1 4-hydroxybenzoate 3-monooxygenase [Streptomyces sp. 8L]